MSYSCIPSLTFEQFFEVSKQLRSIDLSERQKIMKALRGAKHLGNPTLRVDQEDDAVGTLAISTDLTMKQSVSVSTIGRTMHSSKIYDDFSESDSLTYSMNSRDRSFSSSNSSKDMNKADGYYKAKAFEVFDSDTTGEAKYEDIYSKIVEKYQKEKLGDVPVALDVEEIRKNDTLKEKEKRHDENNGMTIGRETTEVEIEFHETIGLDLLEDTDSENSENDRQTRVLGQLSIRKWLDSVKSGYGLRLGHIFEESGVQEFSDLQTLSRNRIESIYGKLKNSMEKSSSRRRLRAALRAHLPEMSIADDATRAHDKRNDTSREKEVPDQNTPEMTVQEVQEPIEADPTGKTSELPVEQGVKS